MKTNVVLFWFMNDWGKYGRAYEKIAQQLSRHERIGRVLCILPPGQKPAGLKGWPFDFSLRSPRLTVLSVSRIVAAQGAPFRFRAWLNEWLQRLALRLFLARLGFHKRNTILWVFPPHSYVGSLLQAVPHSRMVTQIVDNNAVLEKLDSAKREFADAQYRALAARADAVVVSSDMNYEIFSTMNGNCHKFENAVDAEFISPPTVLPCIATQSRPRLGYVGWMSERTDLDLLLALAASRPGHDIVLAGPSEVDMARLLAQPNVSWLGPLGYAEVAEFMRSLDVCLIPHKDSPYSRSMSPLKLFQYLATGRPIVSTPVAGVERWRDHVFIAQSHEEFIRKVDEAIATESLEKAAARVRAAEQETWEVRVDEMIGAVLA